jgi:hypothetical protein
MKRDIFRERDFLGKVRGASSVVRHERAWRTLLTATRLAGPGTFGSALRRRICARCARRAFTVRPCRLSGNHVLGAGKFVRRALDAAWTSAKSALARERFGLDLRRAAERAGRGRLADHRHAAAWQTERAQSPATPPDTRGLISPFVRLWELPSRRGRLRADSDLRCADARRELIAASVILVRRALACRHGVRGADAMSSPRTPSSRAVRIASSSGGSSTAGVARLRDIVSLDALHRALAGKGS